MITYRDYCFQGHIKDLRVADPKEAFDFLLSLVNKGNGSADHVELIVIPNADYNDTGVMWVSIMPQSKGKYTYSTNVVRSTTADKDAVLESLLAVYENAEQDVNFTIQSVF